MSITTSITAATLAAFALSVAGLARADQGPAGTLLWDCARDGAPSLGQVRQLFGTGNSAYASTLRLRLQAQLRAECQRISETGQVLFVLQRPAEDEVTAVMVARNAPDAPR